MYLQALVQSHDEITNLPKFSLSNVLRYTICILFCMPIFSETSSVVTKRNPSRKQCGLSRLPVDRKQAYLQETAQQDQTLHSTQSDQCEVEYDSDEDTNVSNADPTNTVNTKPVDTSNNNDDDKLNSAHKEAKKLFKDDSNSVKKLNLKVAEEEDKSIDIEAL